MAYKLKAAKGYPGGRAKLLRDVRAYHRELDQKRVAELRAAIADVRKRRKGAAAKVRAKCRVDRAKVRQQIAEYRDQERARINREVDEMRQAARRACDARKDAVRRSAESSIAKQRAKLAEEKQLQRELRHAEGYRKRRHAAVKASAKEVRQEDDDRVRANIDPELLPVFETVKRSIRAKPGMSRTEAFLHYVETNAGDVVAIQQAAADREVAKLLREQAKAEREQRRRRKNFRPTAAELDAYLAEVPF